MSIPRSVSLTRSKWCVAIDHSQYWCGRKQNLYFTNHNVRHIKIIATQYFGCDSLKVSYSLGKPKLVSSIICSFENLCTVQSAYTLDASIGALLSNKITFYDNGTKFASCKIKDELMIFFKQPYLDKLA